jgi:hypothetical protein
VQTLAAEQRGLSLTVLPYRGAVGVRPWNWRVLHALQPVA